MIPPLFRLLCLFLALCTLTALPVSADEAAPFTQEMIGRSFISAGNTERLHRAIDKAKNGEPVSIVYLGGSITEGSNASPRTTNCYAYRSAQLFAEKFMADPAQHKAKNGEPVSIVYLGGSITEGSNASPRTTNCYAYRSAQLFAEKFMADPAQLKYHNAGISGTPSLLGVTRCEQDVLSHNPDIVFVEFAVNDGTDGNSRLAYESLVCKLLERESQPAVILIFTLTQNGYNAQEHMQKIGRHYNLGMISIKDAVWPAIQQGALTWRDYSSDEVHPNNAGHAFMAECIGYYLDQAAAAESAPFTLPAKPLYGRTLAALQNLRQDDPAITNPGMFDYGAVNCYSYKKGWRHMSNRNDQGALTFTVDATLLTVVFKQETNAICGKAEVWVDGKCKATLNSRSDSAWGNPVTQLVFLGKGIHTVEIRMAEDSLTKTFNLLDVGYSK